MLNRFTGVGLGRLRARKRKKSVYGSGRDLYGQHNYESRIVIDGVVQAVRIVVVG